MTHLRLDRLAWFLLLPMALSAGTGDAPPVHQVFDPPRRPKDIRLQRMDHLDQPAPFQPSYTTQAAWEKRASELRQQLLVALGLWPMLPRPPIEAVIHGKIDRDAYTVEKVYFSSLPGHFVSGSLYRPKDRTGRRPAILMPHGHHAHGRFNQASDAAVQQEMKSGAEKTKESARYPLQARCAMLARLGCVVFHYDMVGYADSQAIPHRAGFSGVMAESLGQSAMGLQTWNSLRALDFLASLPDVDPQRIGVTGASGGGTQTFILCAIDDRPACAFPAVMVSMNMQGGCICENASHLRVGTNNVEIAALMAPRPLAMTGANDWTRDIESRGLPELKKIYALYGAADKVAAKYYPFPHNYNQVSAEMMYAWFNRHLALGHAEPILEQPFEPIPVKELAVYDQEHQPKRANADSVSAQWAFYSEQAWLESSVLLETYRSLVGPALRVLLHGDWPAPGVTQAHKLGTASGDGFYIWKGTQLRTDRDVEIPLISLVPKNSRTAIVWLHPKGKASLFDDAGRPIPAARRMLDAGASIIAPDLLLTGEYQVEDQPAPLPWPKQVHHQDIPFMGFRYGYNRTLLAERVNDALTVLAHLKTRQDVDKLYLIGLEEMGPVALLACAQAKGRIDRTVVDLNQFDFDQVQSLEDDRLLPGAWRFGGLLGFVPLIEKGECWITNARRTRAAALADATPGVKRQTEAADLPAMVDWLLRP